MMIEKSESYYGHERISSVVGEEQAVDMQAFLTRHDIPLMIVIKDAEAWLVGSDQYGINLEPLPGMLRGLADQVESQLRVESSEPVH